MSHAQTLSTSSRPTTKAAQTRVYTKYLAKIQKRDGRIVPFEFDKIMGAIQKAMHASNEGSPEEAEIVAHKVAGEMLRIAKIYKNFLPTVEGCQDEVERQLMLSDCVATAKAYILYRAKRSEARAIHASIPEHVRKLAEESAKYFEDNPLGEFVYLRTYARWIPSEKRRETWIETVDRYINFMRENLGDKLLEKEYAELRGAILRQEVMPSMRAMQFSGDPARKCNSCVYNCTYTAPTKLEDFAEIMYLSMQGCGVGFAVESQNIQQLPQIEKQGGEKLETHVIADSKEGWCDALTLGLRTWYGGKDIEFDFTRIRPAGARLKTMGGKASGPDPLRSLHSFARERILKRQGRRLRNIDAHDIICKIGECVVAGGVRRCLPAGTRIHTRRGSIPIEEVVRGDDVMTASGYKPVTGWVTQGVQQLAELVTESGTVFRCTPNHRIADLSDVWGGYVFKQAQHITKDDRILFITHPIDGVPTHFLPLSIKRNSDHSGSSVSQPQLNADSAWFLGKFFADGYVQITPHTPNGKDGNTTFSIACHESETEQIARVNDWMMRHGLNAGDHASEDERCVKLRSNNRQIARWMYQYKQPNVPLRIPEEIWRGSQDVRAAFVAGVMDGDGTYSDRPITVVSTVYEGFARDIIKILATLGIIAEMRMRRPETPDGWQPLWVASIKDAHAVTRASEIIGMHACGTWIRRKGKQAGYTVPGKFVKRDVPRTLWKQKWPSGRDENMNSATLTELVNAKQYVPVRVVEIRDGGSAKTYDLEVQDGSTFVAEGYLVHNTAMISLSDLDDVELRDAKKGQFYLTEPHRAVANNSAVYESRPNNTELMDEWVALMKSGSGERGIFNRGSLEKTMPRRRLDFLTKKYGSVRKGFIGQIGTNPCGEILLQPKQFCNLSEVVARAADTEKTLIRKAKLAAILGTYQSTLTKFNYISKEWTENCEEERLLGVSVTGQWDSPAVRNESTLQKMRDAAIAENKKYAKRFSIPQSMSVTAVKPSGTVSQTLDCSSGLHPRHSAYYIRRVRISATDSLFKLMRDQGVPHHPEVGQSVENANTFVIEFPVKAPDQSVFKNDLTALQQLEYWKTVKLNYTEHNPSATISVGEDEWIDVVSWIEKNWEIIGGLSFLPRENHVYRLAPYQTIDETTYEKLASEFPVIDYSKLITYERTDETEQARELACAGGTCEIEPIPAA
mgnify:FL=1